MPAKKTPEKQFICTRCGKAYFSRTGNSPRCSSPMWVRNDGFIPVCNDCIQSLYDEYLQKLGSRDAAIYRLCMKFDVYYSESVMAMVSQGNKQFTNPFKAYLSKVSLQQISFNSFDDTLAEQAVVIISSEDDLDNIEKNGVKISRRSFNRWGADTFEPAEYADLDAHYKLLTGTIQDWGQCRRRNQKSLCARRVAKSDALRAKDYPLHMKLSEQYRKGFKDAGFKIVQNNTEMENQPMGVMAMVVEDLPAEYYKDKALFADFDSINDYWQRFIVPPIPKSVRRND